MLRKGTLVGLILIVMMLIALPVFGAGGGQSNAPGTGSLADPLLRGRTIQVASWWANYDVNTYEPRSEGEARDLEMRRRLLRDNNMTMRILEISDWEGYFPLVVNNILSGNKNYHIYEVPANLAITLYKQGLLYAVSDSRAVNFANREPVAYQRPMYNGLVQDFMTFNGKQYGWQYGLPNDSWGQAMLYFNTRYLVEAGFDANYLYDLQRNNTWTWDAFFELCRRLTRDTTGDGIIDRYAIHMDDAREFIKGLVYANGGNFVAFDAQGRATSAINSPAVIEALNFYNRLVNEGFVMTTAEYDWGQNWTAFEDGRIAMTFDPEWRKGQMNANFEAGYVLPPRGPRQNQLRMDAMDNVYVIPNIFTAAEVDSILKAAEMWFTPTDTDWLQGHFWASRNLRDVTETVVMSRDARYLTLRDFALIPNYPFDDFIEEFRNGLGSTNPAQLIESWTPRFNAAIADFNR